MQNVKSNKKKVKLQFLIFLAIALIPFAFADSYSDVLLYDASGSTNYSIYFNSSNPIWCESFNVTTDGRIQIYNPVGNQTNVFIGYNINNSISVIEFYGLNNALIYNSSNDIQGSANINDNDGNINVTIGIGSWIKVLNDYNFTEGTTRLNDPIDYIGKTTTVKSTTYHFNSTLADNITIAIYNLSELPTCNLDSVFFSYKGFPFDAFFTCESNSVTITSGTLGDSSANSDLVIDYHYNDYNDDICTTLVGSYGNFAKFIPIFFSIIGVLLIIGIIGMVIYTVNNPGWYGEIDLSDYLHFDGFSIKWFFISIGFIAIFSVVSIIAIYSLCLV